MIEVTVAADGTIELPSVVSERFGIRPGTRLALVETEDVGGIHLRVLPARAALIEKDGIWIIESRHLHQEDKDVDWVERVRDERSASVLGDG
jgi:bifunctional DNA-binding transcriptional regulator/antitoxin component of YhaV-PrlF toxin-antitoxin module